MDIINELINRAKQDIKTIVLPESEDIRILKAAEEIIKLKFANIILIGNEEKIKNLANSNTININNVSIINPLTSDKLKSYSNKLFELRKNKGMTEQQAKTILLENSRYFATMMVKTGDADGMVSGACNPTSDTLKPALQIIKGAPGIDTVSAFFIMVLPNKEFGKDGVFIFSDCGMNENPNSKQLSEIAITSAETFKELISNEEEPKVAMLSYSTMGSANSELTQKVIEATNFAKQKRPDLMIDGEMQLDAAIVPDVAKSKAQNSNVAGHANVLIFPDLNSGNIGYKLTQRFGHAKAYGPICQGLDKPINDLSRGCTAEDIIGVVAITCVQALNKKGDF